jgi:aspartyl-tRNA(Asn)/glutamyl-tRNA(Gln) amidotransferase subunit A
MNYFELDAVEVADGVRTRRFSAADVLEESLERIDRLNPPLNAFVFVDEERARGVAADIDRRVQAGEDPGPLAGVPLGIKELEAVAGWPNTRASTVWRDRIGEQTSTMSTRLLAAGAVPVGLTAAPENGLLFFTNSVLHGPTRNPWDTTRTPGGSSGGAGAALAAGLVNLATGSDMGGSIRLPAGWCGVVGVKGTFGRVPRGPGWLGGSNLTHYGPLARSVTDAARYLDCAVGVDSRDPWSLPAPAVPFERAIGDIDLAGLRIAIVDDNGMCPTDPGVRAAVGEAVDALTSAEGLKTVGGITIDLPDVAEIGGALLFADLDPELLPFMGEVHANLLATEGAAELLAIAFDPSGLNLEGIGKANVFRHTLNVQLAGAFDEVDLLAVPTSPVPAFGATGPVPLTVAGRECGATAAASFTSMFNLSGHPAVSVPAGIVEGCPVGVQLVARRHDDALALAAAAALERAHPWPKLAPYASS